MGAKYLYFFVALFVYFLLPDTAYAWGPGAHMTYALHALSQVALLSLPIRSLLKKFPNEFLYGTIAADIILGKKYSGELYHCHHWEVALPLLEKAKTDEEKTFLFGYLGHLAVDTVAHNFYVPYKIIYSYQARALRHTYWEMRFDEKMDPNVWGVIEGLANRDFTHLDSFLEKNLKRTIFNFSTNKKIFNSLLLLQRMKRWRKASGLLARRSTFQLTANEVRNLKNLCFEVLLEFLEDPQNARVLRADPSGNLKLLYAKEMVRDLKSYRKRRILSQGDADNLVVHIRKKLRQNLYQPGDLPLITDGIQ
jgi:hypothetical protein